MEKNDIIIDKICESGLSRIEHWMNAHDIACISACRSYINNITDGTNPEDVEKYKEAKANFVTDGNKEFDGVSVGKDENVNRTRQLKAKLLVLGYGVTEIDGSYVEDFGTPNPKEVAEHSFFVVNLKDVENFFDHLFELGEYFNQDSVLFKPKGESAFLIGTNKGDFPGYGMKTRPKQYHALAGRFMSRIRNAAFAFADKNKLVMCRDKYDTNEKDAEDYDSEFLFRNDVDRPLIKKENVNFTSRLVESINKFYDGLMLETVGIKTVRSYEPRQCYAMGGVAQFVNNGLQTIKENREKRKINMATLKSPVGMTPLTEANLNRLMHHARHGMVVLSANRSSIYSENPKLDLTGEYERYLAANSSMQDCEETRELWLSNRNKKADADLESDIRKAGFAFSKTFGGYHGKDSVVDSYEPSYVVYNHAPSHSNDYRNFDDLQKFAIQMCGKYKQESVYVQKPGTPPPAPQYLKADGSVDMEFSGKFRLNRDDAEFYTTTKRDRTNPQRFTAEGVERLPKQQGKSHTQLFFEGMFCSSGPADYPSRMKRTKAGEVFLNDK